MSCRNCKDKKNLDDYISLSNNVLTQKEKTKRLKKNSRKNQTSIAFLLFYFYKTIKQKISVISL